MKRFILCILVSGALTGCGGNDNQGNQVTGESGGNNSDNLPPSGASNTGSGLPLSGSPIATASSKVVAQCVAPRPAGTINPMTGKPYADTQGSLDSEKQWVRAFVNETYLWYPEVPTVDASKYVSGATVRMSNPADNTVSSRTLTDHADVLDAYFNSQRSPLLNVSGTPKDKFHFTMPSDAFLASEQGDSAGFGFQIDAATFALRSEIVVTYTDPGTPAADNQLARGTIILQVNDVNLAKGITTEAMAATVSEALNAPVPGRSYTFQVQDAGSSTARTVTMVAGAMKSTPVQNVRTLPAPNNRVGYLLFNQHTDSAESQLAAAVNQLKASNGGAGITDLVLDLRYNSGGNVNIASELAYMIAGPVPTAGKVFEKNVWNDKHPLGADDAVLPFHGTAQGYSMPEGTALPHLGLPRVFILTGSDTCSASESIINSLNGIGVKVVLIGEKTCGKPYGFIPQDNCGTTYFTVQYKGVNQLGYGDYVDGFLPGGTGTSADNLPGCLVADDLSKPLGDIGEARLAAALHYRATGSCPAVTTAAATIAATTAPTRLTALGNAVFSRSPVSGKRIYSAQH